MKKLFIIPLLVFLFACGPASVPQEAESTVGITAPDGYAVACVLTFNRAAPHLCHKFTLGADLLILDGTCRSVDFPTAYGLGARQYTFKISSQILVTSNSGVGSLRFATTNFYTSTGCGIVQGVARVRALEQVVTAADTTLFEGYQTLDVASDAAGLVWYLGSVNGGTNTKILVTPTGYYD